MAIEAKITLNNEEFKKGLKDSERQATSSMKKIGGSSSGAGSLMTSIANASKNAADIAAKGFSGVTDALSKMGPYGAAAAAAVLVGVPGDPAHTAEHDRRHDNGRQIEVCCQKFHHNNTLLSKQNQFTCLP